MAAVAPGGAGLPPDQGHDPNLPADAPPGDSDDDFTDEEEADAALRGVSRRIQCPVCLRYVAKSTGLKRHLPKCVGPRGYTGHFPCMIKGCGLSYLRYADLMRHFRLKHAGRKMPEIMKHYRR